MKLFATLLVLVCVSLGCRTNPRYTGEMPLDRVDFRKAQIAASQGDEKAQYVVAKMYMNGRGVPKDDVSAAYWFRKSAEQGYAESQLNLGMMLAFGFGGGRDEQEAMTWLKKASAQGNAEATHYMRLLEEGNLEPTDAPNQGMPMSGVDDVARLRREAEQGNVDAQYQMGEVHVRGKLAPLDFETAAMWFHKAAEQGDARAQDQLGVLYATGRGVEQNYETALTWLQKSAAQNHPAALSNLGLMYLRGRGTPQSDAKAAENFLKAAELGHASAQFRIGFLYAEGRGVEKSYPQALGWYNKSAQQGNVQAQNGLAWLLATCPLDALRDGASAIHYAHAACEKSKWHNTQYMMTLAAAFAEAGQFEQAIHWQTEAMKLVSQVVPGGPDPEMQARLDLYRQNRPFRDY